MHTLCFSNFEDFEDFEDFASMKILNSLPSQKNYFFGKSHFLENYLFGKCQFSRIIPLENIFLGQIICLDNFHFSYLQPNKQTINFQLKSITKITPFATSTSIQFMRYRGEFPNRWPLVQTQLPLTYRIRLDGPRYEQEPQTQRW